MTGEAGQTSILERILTWTDAHAFPLLIVMLVLVFGGSAIGNAAARFCRARGWYGAADRIARISPIIVGGLRLVEGALWERLQARAEAAESVDPEAAVKLEENVAELESLAKELDDPRVVELAQRHRAKVGGASTQSLPPIA